MNKLITCSFLLFLLIGCGVSKAYKNEINHKKSEDIDEELYSKDTDSIIIYNYRCGLDSLIFDNRKGFSNPRYSSLKQCVLEKSFHGELYYENQLLQMIKMEFELNNNFVNSLKKPLRGSRVFEEIFKRSNRFDCIKGSHYDTNEHQYLFNVYSECIESIDKLTLNKYLDRKVSQELSQEEHLQIIALEEDDCSIRKYKLYYKYIKEAYDKNLVKIKNYGQKRED